MMLTISNVTDELKTRFTGYLDKAIAITGEDKAPSVQSCMAWSARQIGLSPTQLRSVSDAELATITSVDAFLDLAELRMLETVQTNLSDVTTQTGPVREDWNDLSKRIADLIKQKRASIAVQHRIYLDIDLVDAQTKPVYIHNL